MPNRGKAINFTQTTHPLALPPDAFNFPVQALSILQYPSKPAKAKYQSLSRKLIIAIIALDLKPKICYTSCYTFQSKEICEMET